MNEWRGFLVIVSEQAARLPEVRTDSAVAGVEEAGEFSEVAVLLAIELLVQTSGGLAHGGVGPDGLDVGGSHDR